jgi:pancreatic lipase-related protein 2
MMLTPLIDAKREYLQRGDYNLFFVDWAVLGPAPCE